MKIKSIAQYHKLHKMFPRMAGLAAKETDVTKLPLKMGDRLVRYRGKLSIKRPKG